MKNPIDKRDQTRYNADEHLERGSEMNVTILANHIGEIRKKRGYTQKQFAAKLGWTLRKLTSYERGERIPPLTEAEMIAHTLNANISSLWEFEYL